MTAARHKMLHWSGARTAYTAVCLGAIVVMELGAWLYRPWVAAQDVHDFGIAGTLDSHVGTVAQIFAVLAIVHATREEARLIVGLVTVGYCAYRLGQVWLPGSTDGLDDVAATVVGGFIAFGLLSLVERWTEPG